MPYDLSPLTRALAEAIRLWHERYGIRHRPANMDDAEFRRYQHRVAHFSGADLSAPPEQQAIAREQQSGVFEWHYTAPMPADLWREVAQRFEVPQQPAPQHLGEAARCILDHLPFAEAAAARPDDGLRVAVEADTRKELLRHAHSVYAGSIGEQVPAVGGINALLSCSMERYPWAEGGGTMLLRPPALGLRVVDAGERPDDLIDAIRFGVLIVDDVIGEPAESCPAPDPRDAPEGGRRE